MMEREKERGGGRDRELTGLECTRGLHDGRRNRKETA